MSDARTKPAATRSPAVISAHEVYGIAEFQRRAGLAAPALRAAKRNGLRVIRAGKRSYVLGRDWLAYLERCAERKELTD